MEEIIRKIVKAGFTVYRRNLQHGYMIITDGIHFVCVEKDNTVRIRPKKYYQSQAEYDLNLYAKKVLEE